MSACRGDIEGYALGAVGSLDSWAMAATADSAGWVADDYVVSGGVG